MKLKLLLSLFLLGMFVMQAQDADAALEKKVKEISKGACECIAKINTSLDDEKKNEEIKACITAGIMEDQVNNSLLLQLEKVKDTLEKTRDISKLDSINITGDKNFTIVIDKNYDEIEEYLLRNCEAIKLVLMVADQKHKNSVSDKKKALKYYDEGTRLYQSGQYENAVVLFQKAVKKDRKFAFAWDNLGICYRKLGNYKQAIKAYKKSLKLDPKGKVPLMNLPIAQEMLEKYDDAIDSYKKFSELYPNDPEAYYGIGRIYIFKKDYENALDNVMKAYKMYLELNSPYNKDAQQLISALYIEMKKNDQLEAFNKIAKKHKIDINIKE